MSPLEDADNGETEPENAEISLNAILGSNFRSAMKLGGMLGECEVLLLVDSRLGPPTILYLIH